MSFDKRAYMREYMRKKRAVDPSYGQPSSRNGYEEEEEYDEEYEVPQLTWQALIVIIVAIGLGLLFAWIYFKFFYKEHSSEEEWTI